MTYNPSTGRTQVHLRIRDLREDADKTQQQIADVLQIRQRMYSYWETETIRIPVAYLVELAFYYDVSLDYITGISRVRRPFPKK